MIVDEATMQIALPPRRFEFRPTEAFSDEEFFQLCQRKMQEYLDHGLQLGWLIDPNDRRVYIYRPDESVETLNHPQALSASPVLPGFTLDLTPIWDPDL